MSGHDQKNSPYVLNAEKWPSFEEALHKVRHIGLTILSTVPGLNEWTKPRIERNEAQDMIAWSLFQMDDATKSFRLMTQAQAGYNNAAATVGEFQIGNYPFPLSPSTLRGMGDTIRGQGARRMNWDIDRRFGLLQEAARAVLANEAERREAAGIVLGMRDALEDGITPAAIERMRGVATPSALSLHVPERIYPYVFDAAIDVADDPGGHGFANISEALEGCLSAAGLPQEACTIVGDYMLAGIEARHISAQLGNEQAN